MIEEQRNNPLHGIKLEFLLTELVDHYGWEVLADAMNFNCFKSNPGIKSSLKFLRKTPWAREKVEGFYLYKFKRLPKPSDEQYDLPPRDRTISLDQQPRSPAEISVSKPENGNKSNPYGKAKLDRQSGSDSGSGSDSDSDSKQDLDVWAHWRK